MFRKLQEKTNAEICYQNFKEKLDEEIRCKSFSAKLISELSSLRRKKSLKLKKREKRKAVKINMRNFILKLT
jgi:hypothetical protein